VAKRAFVAFSGGGAKGVVHVGALKALEQQNVRLIGVSGTSAGAIIAALSAAGYTADELIDADSGETILKRITAIDPSLRCATDLFGKSGWWKIRLFRFILRQPLPLPVVAIILWALPPLFVTLATLLARGSPLPWALSAWALTGVGMWLLERQLAGGLADTGRFRKALGELLQQQIFPKEPGRVVRMDDFGQDGRPQLKIVSANLTTRKLHLFSSDRTPQVPVADAVAASMCLPVIFQLVAIDGELHVDGGIVSNLPAWPFDEERELDPEALTISVEIEDDPRKKKLDRFSWMPAAISTTLFGSAELNLRIAGPAEQLALPTTFDVLDFDKPASAVAAEVSNVAKAVSVRLDRRLLRLPEIYRDACKVIQTLALDALGLPAGGAGNASRVRVAIGKLERGYVNSLRLSYSVGYDEDPDEGILVPIKGSVAGAAWRDRQSLFERHPLPADKDLPGPANRLRRKCRWVGARWIMCIPIMDGKGEPRLLVQIEGNQAVRQSARTDTALQVLEGAVVEFSDLILNVLNELEE
jgi:NTE family protein